MKNLILWLMGFRRRRISAPLPDGSRFHWVTQPMSEDVARDLEMSLFGFVVAASEAGMDSGQIANQLTMFLLTGELELLHSQKLQ